MKKLVVSILAVFLLGGCQTATTTTQTPSKDWPTEDIGSGTFDISSPSGSTADDKEVFIFDDGINNSIGFEAWDMDGTKLTYFYINDEEMESHQIGYGHQGYLYLPENVGVGTHKARAVQYVGDTESDIVFYREHEFEIK